MNEVSSTVPGVALANLESAYKRFFKTKKGFPQFKKKGKQDSFTVKQKIMFFDNKIKLPKIGIIRLKEHGYIPLGKPIRHAPKWCYEPWNKTRRVPVVNYVLTLNEYFHALLNVTL